MASGSQSSTALFRKPEFVILIIYLISVFLILLPYYNYFYRIGIIFFNCLIFPLTLFTLVFILVPFYLINHRLKKALLIAGFGLLTLLLQSQFQEWRYSITDFYLQNTHCNLKSPVEGNVLGGITEIKLGGNPTSKTGAFENSTHCLMVVCEEEFYYCSWSRVRIGP